MYRVVFPFELKLPNTTDDAAGRDALYSLFAVVVHVGSGPHHGARWSARGRSFADAGLPVLHRVLHCSGPTDV
jgi:hypothetical protein